MYGLVIVHEDGAVISTDGLLYDVVQQRFADACRTNSVVYAHYSNQAYQRVNHYVRPGK